MHSTQNAFLLLFCRENCTHSSIFNSGDTSFPKPFLFLLSRVSVFFSAQLQYSSNHLSYCTITICVKFADSYSGSSCEHDYTYVCYTFNMIPFQYLWICTYNIWIYICSQSLAQSPSIDVQNVLIVHSKNICWVYTMWPH